MFILNVYLENMPTPISLRFKTRDAAADASSAVIDEKTLGPVLLQDDFNQELTIMGFEALHLIDVESDFEAQTKLAVLQARAQSAAESAIRNQGKGGLMMPSLSDTAAVARAQ